MVSDVFSYTVNENDFERSSYTAGVGITIRSIIDRLYNVPNKADYDDVAELNRSRVLVGGKSKEHTLDYEFKTNIITDLTKLVKSDESSKYGQLKTSSTSLGIYIEREQILDTYILSGGSVLLRLSRIKKSPASDLSEGNFWDAPIKTPWLSLMASLGQAYSKAYDSYQYFHPTVKIKKKWSSTSGATEIVIPSTHILDVSYSQALNSQGGVLAFSVYSGIRRHMLGRWTSMLLNDEDLTKTRYLDISPGDYVELSLESNLFRRFVTSTCGILKGDFTPYIGMVSGVSFTETPDDTKLSVVCTELSSVIRQEGFFRLRTAQYTKFTSKKAGEVDSAQQAIDNLVIASKNSATAKETLTQKRQWGEELDFRVLSFEARSRDMVAKLFHSMFLTNRSVGDVELINSLALEIEPQLNDRYAFLSNIVTMEAPVEEFMDVYMPYPFIEKFPSTYWHAKSTLLKANEVGEFPVLAVNFAQYDRDIQSTLGSEDLVSPDDLLNKARLVFRRNPLTPGLQAGLPVLDIKTEDILNQSIDMYDVLSLSTCFTVNFTAWSEFNLSYFCHPTIVIDYLAQRFGYKLKRVENNMFRYKSGDSYFLVQALYDCYALAQNEIMMYITDTATLTILFNPFILPGMRIRWDAGKAGRYNKMMYSGYVTSVQHVADGTMLSKTEVKLDYVCPHEFLTTPTRSIQDILSIFVPVAGDSETKFNGTEVMFNEQLFEDLYQS